MSTAKMTHVKHTDAARREAAAKVREVASVSQWDAEAVVDVALRTLEAKIHHSAEVKPKKKRTTARKRYYNLRGKRAAGLSKLYYISGGKIKIEPTIVKSVFAKDLPNAPLFRVRAEAVGSLGEFGFTEDEINYFVVPKRTLARRQAQKEPLSVEETDKALRLGRIASQAARVFGNADKANRWLRKSKRQLSGETPLAFLSSEAGARVVEEMLLRIEHGILA